MDSFLIRVYSQEDIYSESENTGRYRNTTLELGTSPIRKTFLNDPEIKHTGVNIPTKRAISSSSHSDECTTDSSQTKDVVDNKENLILRKTFFNDGSFSADKENFSIKVIEALPQVSSFSTNKQPPHINWASCTSSDSEDNESKVLLAQNHRRYPWTGVAQSPQKDAHNFVQSGRETDSSAESFNVQKNVSEVNKSYENISDKRTKYNLLSETNLYSRHKDSQRSWSPVHYKRLQRKSMPTYHDMRDAQKQAFSTSKRMRPNNRTSYPTYHNSQENINIREAYLKDCSSGIGFVDTHCHLDFLFRRLNFRGSFTAFKLNCESTEKFPSNFEGCISIFCEPVTFSKKYFWEKLLVNASVWSAFGCHPHFANTFTEETDELMQYALKNEKVIALGEIGLDYSYKNNVPKETQKAVLKSQITMAILHKKPIIIHCRDAHLDCLDICQQYIPANHPIHRHCFTESWSEACDWMTAFPNLKFGFTCLLLRKDQYRLKEVVSKLPIDKILLETDAPYFKPNFVTDMKCAHPGMAVYVAKEVASIKHKTIDDILIQVRKNTREVYSI